MKILPVVLFVASLLFVGCHRPAAAPAVKAPVVFTLQQKATHMIMVMDVKQRVGLCTATAIGPHALLTATHCNEYGEGDTIRVDLSTRRYNIQKTLTDDRDHDIYLVDGPEFQNIVPYKVRPAVLGEHVYLWGDGHGEYPSTKKEGKSIESKDPSDVDASQGVAYFDIKVIPGDSGSAVYADDGSLVAVTTYAYDDRDKNEHYTIDFTPNFTPEQITEAKAYVPVKHVDKVVKEKPEPRMSFLDLFGR